MKIQQQFRFLNAAQGIPGFENVWFISSQWTCYSFRGKINPEVGKISKKTVRKKEACVLVVCRVDSRQMVLSSSVYQ